MASAATAKQWFEDGKVREATKELTFYLRDCPADTTQRIFLFELLCFAGDFDRAEKQLAVLAQGSSQAELGAVLYYSALHAEKIRHQTFEKQEFSSPGAIVSPTGTLNGRHFQSLRDADPDLGPRLEVFAAGAYLWIPFEHIESVQVKPPRRLRDTLWAPAIIRTAPSFKSMELGEVLIPLIYPFSWRNSDESVWLGRTTVWAADEQEVAYPSGQKILQMDGEEVSFLEVRSLDFSAARAVTPAAAG